MEPELFGNMSEKLIVNEEDSDLVPSGDFDPAGSDIYNYQGQPFTGIMRTTFDDGTPLMDVEYKSGYEEGVVIEYLGTTGKKWEERHLKYGVLNGDYKRWKENGELIYHARWEDGKEVEIYFGDGDNYEL